MDIDNIVNKLVSSVKVFNGLTRQDVSYLIKSSQTISYTPDTLIVEQNASSDSFYIILIGEVDVLIDKEIVMLLLPGDTFGEMGFVTKKPRTASCRTKSACVVIKITEDTFKTNTLQENVILKNMLKDLSFKLEIMSDKYIDVVKRLEVGLEELHEAKMINMMANLAKQ